MAVLARASAAETPHRLGEAPPLPSFVRLRGAEPDEANRDIVVRLILEAKSSGVAIVGIFHDVAVRRAVADCLYEIVPLQDAA